MPRVNDFGVWLRNRRYFLGWRAFKERIAGITSLQTRLVVRLFEIQLDWDEVAAVVAAAFKADDSVEVDRSAYETAASTLPQIISSIRRTVDGNDFLGELQSADDIVEQRLRELDRCGQIVAALLRVEASWEDIQLILAVQLQISNHKVPPESLEKARVELARIAKKICVVFEF